MEKIVEVLERFARLFRANKLLVVTVGISWWGTWGWLLFIDAYKAKDLKDIQLKDATDETIRSQKQTIEVLQNQINKGAAPPQSNKNEKTIVYPTYAGFYSFPSTGAGHYR